MAEPSDLPAPPKNVKPILIGICGVLLVAIIGIFIMAHTVPSFRAQSAVPETCDIVIYERGRGRAIEQVRIIRRYMSSFGGKIHVLLYGGAAGTIDGAEIIPITRAFTNAADAVLDAAASIGPAVRFVLLGDQTVPLRSLRIGDMFSATGKFRFFGGDDTDETDAAFKMYNETIAPVVVFDPAIAAVDEEYVYKLHFSKTLRHATDMTFDIFMMRDQDMNQTQVNLARESGRMMATFHLPSDALAKIPADERAQKNAELIQLLKSF